MRRLFVVVLFFVLGARFFFWYEFPNIGRFSGSYIEVIGKMRSGVLQSESVVLYGHRYKTRGNVWLPRNFTYKVYDGDTLQLSGPLVQSDKVLSLQTARVIEIKKSALAKLIDIRGFLLRRIERLYTDPAAGMVSALLLGERSSLPSLVRKNFQRAGVSHIVAISGMHIVLIIGFCVAMLKFVPKNYRWICVVTIICFFVLMTGARPSTVRAGIMGSIVLIADSFGRPMDRLRILFSTIYFMILLQPYVLVDVGFQLSCAATGGIIVLNEKIKSKLKYVPDVFGVRDALSVSLAAQIATTPFILWYFKSISLVAPIANIFIVPLVAPIMFGGALSIIFGQLLSAPTTLLVNLFFVLVGFFSGLPWAFFEVGIS